MVKKKLVGGKELIDKMMSAVQKISDPVLSTMGPAGNTVILSPGNGTEPVITKDGVTVAKFSSGISEDPFENTVIDVVKQAAISTNSTCGDGTTTSTALTSAIIKLSKEFLEQKEQRGESFRSFKLGMRAAVDYAIKELESRAAPIASLEDIKNIATISANGDTTIGELIATAVDQVGKDGAITIEDSKSYETSLHIIDGFKLKTGVISNTFLTDQIKNTATLKSPLVMITDEVISNIEQVYPALEIAARDSSPLFIVADEVEDQALAALVMNAVRGTMKVLAVKAPGYGEEKRGILKDLALSTGATFISKEYGKKLQDVSLEQLGTAEKVESSKFTTIIIGGNSDVERVEQRVESLKEEMRNYQIEDHACKVLQERITNLISGAAVIKIGGTTSVEVKEKQYRFQDALEAVKASLSGGIIPGGGSALLEIASTLQSSLRAQIKKHEKGFEKGVSVIESALEEPFKQIARNAYLLPDKCKEEVLEAKQTKTNSGYNFKTCQLEEDLLKAGIIDPVKVTKTALTNAFSAAGTLLSISFAIVELPDEKDTG